MKLPTDPETFRVAGESAAEARAAAYETYSRAASLVRKRAVELDEVLHRHDTAQAVEHRREALAAAVQIKELAQHEHEAADQNWREWLEEYRARQEDDRLTRQEGIARSAKRAAWASAIAALMSFIVAFWQLFGPSIRSVVLHR